MNLYFGFLLAGSYDPFITVVEVKALDLSATATLLLRHGGVLPVLTLRGPDAQRHRPVRRAALF